MKAERLWQVPERLPNAFLVLDDVELAEMNGPLIRLLQRSQDAHERRLPSPVAPEQPEHAGRNVEGDAFQRAGTVRVGPGEVPDREVREHGEALRRKVEEGFGEV